MPVLEMRRAAFFQDNHVLLAPTTMCLEPCARAVLSCESSLAAGIAARLAAGIVKCSSGVVFVADFDPRIQPAQVKRIVGFLPNDRPKNPFCADDYFSYRSALWGLDCAAAIVRGRALVAQIDGLPAPEAALLAGIFLHDPLLIILERPSAPLLAAAQSLLDGRALFVTYGPAESAA